MGLWDYGIMGWTGKGWFIFAKQNESIAQNMPIKETLHGGPPIEILLSILPVYERTSG